MKYRIEINQEKLSETNIDVIDASILDYIMFYCKSPNKKIDKQRIKDEDGDWTWINFGTILKDMPLLRIKSKSSLTPRIKKLEDAGYISSKKINNQKLFVKLNEKIDELFAETNRAVRKYEQIGEKSCSFIRTNNNTIPTIKPTINNNTTNIINSEDKPRSNEQELLNLFYRELNPNIKFNNNSIRNDAKWLVDNYPIDKLIAMVGYIKEHQGEQFFPNITNPSQLRDKMAQVINHKNRQKVSNKIIKI